LLSTYVGYALAHQFDPSPSRASPPKARHLLSIANRSTFWITAEVADENRA